MANSKTGQGTDRVSRKENEQKEKSGRRAGRSKIEQGEEDFWGQSPSYPVKHRERVNVRFTEVRERTKPRVKRELG